MCRKTTKTGEGHLIPKERALKMTSSRQTETEDGLRAQRPLVGPLWGAYGAKIVRSTTGGLSFSQFNSMLFMQHQITTTVTSRRFML